MLEQTNAAHSSCKQTPETFYEDSALKRLTGTAY